jgi:ubiquinone/menaquinone biosynthesis C-methylase UbiE
MTAARDTYTHGHAESVLAAHRWRTAENSAPHLLPYLRAGQDVLDVGCGPGTITVDLARRVAPGHVLGIDLAEGPLAGARATAADQGVPVTFAVGDVYALDLPDDAVDVVHAHQVLQHLGDPVAALREMRRVCRPDGVVAVRDADYAAMTWFPADARLDRWLELYSQVARSNGGEPDAGRRLVSWARAAGFSQVTASASTWCFATEEDRAWWGGTWAERVRSSSLAEQALAGGLSTAAELDGLADAWRAWGRAPDGWFAVLHGEVLARP